MRAAFFYGCMLFFSAYGIFSLVFFLRDFFNDKKYLRGKCVYTLVRMTEDEVYPEETVKALVFKDYKNDTGICERKIIVILEDESGCNARRIHKFFAKEPDVLVLGAEEAIRYLQK